MSVLEALVAAKAAGVRLVLEDGDVFAEGAEMPDGLAEALRTIRPDLRRILEMRDACRAALKADMPPDAYPNRWEAARRGLRRFASEGWADRAALLGWASEELYRVPDLWSQIWLTGAALLINDHKVIAVVAESIVIETSAGSRLKFRRAGEEHARGRD
jgi:hypothetical protein